MVDSTDERVFVLEDQGFPAGSHDLGVLITFLASHLPTDAIGHRVRYKKTKRALEASSVLSVLKEIVSSVLSYEVAESKDFLAIILML